MVKIRLDVVIDTTCPFWLPQILQPNAPKTPIKLTVFSEQTFGPGILEAKFKREEAIGRAEGIKFNQARKIGNTFDSHRLIYLAGEKSLATQSAVVRKLFEGHFEGGEAPSSHEFLIDVAVKSGIERSVAEAWMNSNLGGPEVEEKIREAREKGIRGVPHITVQGTHPIGSLYDEESLLAVFERARVELKA
ncbi:hypothetical protein IFR05_011172 [Cadophora sp. M221]|nr:hypothetical protein IFR05_011172 [Cadophora sp. M221]